MRLLISIGVLLCAVVLALVLLRPAPPPANTARSPGPPASSIEHVPTETRLAARPSRDAGLGAAAAQPRRVAQLGWGNAKDQVGRRADPESPGEGPMSLDVRPDGSLWILDQANGRVLRRDGQGRFGAPIAISADTAQDLRGNAQGGVSVLDRLAGKSLTRYDAAGNLVEEKRLAAIGVTEAGGTTGLFEDPGGLYVEESVRGQARRLLHPLDGSPPLAGRPSRDGRQLLSAAIVDRASGRVVVRGLGRDGAPRWETPLTVDPMILNIPLCDSDVSGGVYIGVLHASAQEARHDLGDERLELFRLGADGALVGRASVPHPPSPLEQFRELSVAGEGRLWWMHPAPDGSGMVVDELTL